MKAKKINQVYENGQNGTYTKEMTTAILYLVNKFEMSRCRTIDSNGAELAREMTKIIYDSTAKTIGQESATKFLYDIG